MSDERSSLPPIPVVDIEDELKRSYLDYAMSVIIGRALPDVRDGLKPVHRRVLYGMWESGNRANRPYKKSARIVGDVMGKYHPHGDGPIYDTVVRLAQDFSMRCPLVDGQGNFGSIDGDSPAAMRYTEVRLTKLAEEMLREDIDKDTVDWVENYDGSESEPQVLPARIPNLLVNGAAGIAVGMATNIPPHNLAETIDAVLMVIDNPGVAVEELMTVLPGPDFPTAGFIHGLAGIRDAYRTGRGSIQLRARAAIEPLGRDRQLIRVSEIPYQVNKARLLERIGELIREKRLEGISDLRDESDRRGIRIIIELKKGEVGEVILNQLYKMTQLQTSFGMNMVAIVDNRPQVLNLRQLLLHFLDHRKTVVVRRIRHDLAKAEARAHLLEGLLRALDLIDAIIDAIRASATPSIAKAALVEQFEFSALQAQAILDMRLQRLTGLEREKLLDEYREVMALIEQLRAILGSDDLLLDEIRSELREIRESYGEERRTEIIPHTHDISIEDLIADEPMVITVTQSGYIKRSPLSLYRAQGRGGKGRKGMDTKNDDVVEHLHIASTHSYVLVFTELGRMHWLKVHRIPESGPNSRGKALVNLLDLTADDRVASTLTVREFDERFVFFTTERGVVKKTPLSAFRRPRALGIIAIGVNDDDRLLDVRLTDGVREIALATRDGYAIRFREDDVRVMGRTARGVRGISLRDGDRVVSLSPLEDEGHLMTVTERGYGKRTPVDDYRLQSRGGMGVINLKVSDKTGPVVGVKQVTAADDMILITEGGQLIRIRVDDVRVIGRSTQGVRVMNLDDADRIVALAKVVDADDADEAALAEAEGAEAAVVDDAEDAIDDAVDTPDADDAIDDQPIN
ncbi:MAG: DNA gyrase subunit A [Acidobacteriota bacterium]